MTYGLCHFNFKAAGQGHALVVVSPCLPYPLGTKGGGWHQIEVPHVVVLTLHCLFLNMLACCPAFYGRETLGGNRHTAWFEPNCHTGMNGLHINRDKGNGQGQMPTPPCHNHQLGVRV